MEEDHATSANTEDDDVHRTTQCMREALKAHLSHRGAAEHQLASFNDFMSRHLPHIVHENPVIQVTSEAQRKRHVVSFGRVRLPQPTTKEAQGFVRAILPSEARLRQITYASSVLVDVIHETIALSDVEKGHPDAPPSDSESLEGCRKRRSQPILSEGTLIERKVYREVLLCKVPVMVRSRYCHSTAIRPTSSVPWTPWILYHQRQREGFLDRRRCETTVLWSSPGKGHLHREIRSLHESKMRSTSTLLIHVSASESVSGSLVVTVCIPFIDLSIPLAVIMKLLEFPIPNRLSHW